MASHPTPELLAHYLEAYPWTGYTKPTAFLHTQVTEQTEDCVWVKLANGGSRGGTHSLHESEEVYEIYLYSSDFNAYKEVLRLLRLYPNGIFFDTFDDLTASTALYTTVTNLAVSGGLGVFTGTASVSKTFTGLTPISMWAFDIAWTATSNFEIRLTEPADNVIAQVYMSGGNLVVYSATATHTLVTTPTTGATYSIVFMNFTGWGGALKADVYVNGTKTLTQQTLRANATGVKDLIVTATQAGQTLSMGAMVVAGTDSVIFYQPRKMLQPTWTFLGENPRNRSEGVWKFTFTYHKLESVT
jgi:hypothetical protein